MKLNPKRAWRWLYGKARAAILGAIASGAVATGAVELAEELNGDELLSAGQRGVILQVVTVAGSLLAMVLRTEDHYPSPVQVQRYMDSLQGDSRAAGEPSPTPPGLGVRPPA